MNRNSSLRPARSFKPKTARLNKLECLLPRPIIWLLMLLNPVVASLAAGQHKSGQVESVVYVESNRADQNSVLAFNRTATGQLTLLGEFPTGGMGVFDLSLALGPFDSDQDIFVNAEHTLLFAVNSGSDTIAVFRIQTNGTLAAIAGSPFPSGGVNPVSVGLARDTLAVVNKAMDPARPSLNQPTYASFYVSADGTLNGPLSTATAAPGSSPSQADISSGKRLVFDAQFLGGMLQSFFIEQNGALTPVDLQALPASEAVNGTAPKPLGLWTHPAHSILYVGFTPVDKLGVYTFDDTGHLSFVRTVPNSGMAICWLRSNLQGTRLYTSNTADSSLSVYDITSPLNPVEIQHLILSGVGNPLQIDMDPRGDFLYVVTQRGSASIPLGQGNTLRTLKIAPQSGTLDEVDSIDLDSGLPLGTRPQGVASVPILR